MRSCHHSASCAGCSTCPASGDGTSLTVALSGNPNVGKSTLFNALTGGAAETANFPGTTVTISSGVATLNADEFRILDLPGAYALGGPHLSDQAVARKALSDASPDVVVVVAAASNLARNLYLVLQVIETGLPVVLALNLMDEAARTGLATDVRRLSHSLRIPVVPTVASRGAGVSHVLSECAAGPHPPKPIRFSHEVEAAVHEVCRALPEHSGARGTALRLLEGDPVATAENLAAAAIAARQAELLGTEGGVARVVAERHRIASEIAANAQHARGAAPTDRTWRIATHPVLGMLVLAGVLSGIVSFLFFAGNAMANAFSALWGATASPVIQGAIHAAAGRGVLARTLLWGFDGGIQAALSVGIPFVLTFYFLLALLEDSGYLNAAAFFADRAMSRLGLHGRAIVPIVAGLGCSVPAVIGTRVLSSRRERTIASFLIAMVPCSARTAVVAGAVARYAGWGPAVALFAADLALVAITGRGLNLLLPGASSSLVMEVFPFRHPVLRHVARKTWHRFRDFVVVAAPVVLIGSLALGWLYETGLVWKISGPLSPIVVGWLRLPPVAGLALLFAVLRKELALQLLVTLAIVRYGSDAASLKHFMTAPQIFTYVLVNTICVPCVATITAMARELGMRRTAGIVAGTVTIALVVGGVAARIAPVFL